MDMGAQGVGSCEVGLEAIHRALTEPLVNGYNAGFYREEARMAVVLVSDEVDGSVVGCPAISNMDFVSWFSGLKPDGLDSLYFAAVVGDQPNGCTSDWGDADPGRGYHEVAEAMGVDHGYEHSICQQDWTPVKDLVGGWAGAVPTSFPLSQVAVEGTLQAFLDLDGVAGPLLEVEIFEDATYQWDHSFVCDADLNSLEFDPSTAPPNGARLRVTYEATP